MVNVWNAGVPAAAENGAARDDPPAPPSAAAARRLPPVPPVTTERRSRLQLQARHRLGLARPAGLLLRARLRLLEQRIAALERQLAGEFATTDTAPLHEELNALTARREALLQALGAAH